MTTPFTWRTTRIPNLPDELATDLTIAPIGPGLALIGYKAGKQQRFGLLRGDQFAPLGAPFHDGLQDADGAAYLDGTVLRGVVAHATDAATNAGKSSRLHYVEAVLPADLVPPDPRDAQVAALEAQVAALRAQVVQAQVDLAAQLAQAQAQAAAQLAQARAEGAAATQQVADRVQQVAKVNLDRSTAQASVNRRVAARLGLPTGDEPQLA